MTKLLPKLSSNAIFGPAIFGSILLTAALGASMLSGCDNATDAPSIDAWKTPEVGTLLVFRDVTTMTRDGQTTRNIATPTYEVIASEQVMFGENNVATILDPYGDTMYVAIRTNGDFAIGTLGAAGISWDVYPTGTRSLITVNDYDSVTNGTDHEIRKTTREFIGEEEIQFADKAIYTYKVVQKETQRLVSEGLWDFLTTATDTLYFAPDFGFYVRQRGSAQNYEFDQLKTTHTSALDLQAYIKK